MGLHLLANRLGLRTAADKPVARHPAHEPFYQLLETRINQVRVIRLLTAPGEQKGHPLAM